jgi:F-type H+-transporting ATPase subunit b
MSQVFAAFGIDWRLLGIDIVNFGLLLLALWYFLYGPLMRMLEVRRQKVAEGVRDADAARRALDEIERSRGALLAKARQEADSVLSSASAAAAQKGRDMLAQAEDAAANVLRDAHAQSMELKRRTLAESKEEVAKLIVLGMEKLNI